MNLPNYFLADLPPGATLSGAMLHEACETLKRNRAQFLEGRTTASLVRLLGELAEAWRDGDYPFRKLALELGPGATGFSRQTLAAGLDDFFSQITVEKLEALLHQDLGDGRRLEQLVSTPGEDRERRAAMACGPELLIHITGGKIPSAALSSVVLGLLVRSAQFVKCATGTSLIPRLFAHSLYEADPKLGACLEVAEWRGGDELLESTLFADAEAITATGSDETLAALHQRIPFGKRFIGYGHRISFGYVAHEELGIYNARKIVARVAEDVIAWDQLGCLSPHLYYLEHGGSVAAERFAEMLSEELARRDLTQPRGALAVEAAAEIASRRSFYEVRAAHAAGTRLWASPGSTAWTVVYEAEARFQTSCLNRFIYIKGVSDLETALQSADAVRGKVSTVGLAASGERAKHLAGQLARWGVSRICPAGEMQRPPLAWRHDGQPALASLVTWSDWEQ